MNSVYEQSCGSSLSNSVNSEDHSDDGQLMEAAIRLDLGEEDEGSNSCKSEDLDDEEVDPRIEDKLEELNQSTNRINTLELEFEEANNNFRAFLTEYSDKLKNLAKKIGFKCVAEARPYYEMKERAKEFQKNCQRTVLSYDRACQSLLLAKEEVDGVEKKFLSHSTGDFDESWQDMFNQATIKLHEAEKMKKECKKNHERCMKEFMAAEETIGSLEKKLKSAIKKSQPYFEESYRFKSHLAKIKTEILMLNEKIVASKSCYAVTLKDLENISEEIHERRNSKLMTSLRREPGVGAEITTNVLRTFNYTDIVPELNISSLDLQTSPYSVPGSKSEHSKSISVSSRNDPSGEEFETCDTYDDQQLSEDTEQLNIKDEELVEVNLD